MKKLGILILLLLLFCGCTSKQTGDSSGAASVPENSQEESSPADTPVEDEDYIVKTLGYYYIEGIYEMFDFLKNPWEPVDNSLYYNCGYDFRFVEQDGRLVLKDMADHGDTTFYDIDGDDLFTEGFNSGEYCSRAVAFLCDENAIRQCFREQGVNDPIQDIVIIQFMDEKVGYIVAAVTEKDAYYMTVPIAAEVYGDFIFQKVYTSEEFKQIYRPHPAKVFINGKEMQSSSVTLLGEMYLELDILDFFEALGFQCKYNQEKKEIIAGDYTIRFEISEDWGDTDTDYEEFIASAPQYTVFLTTPEAQNREMNHAVYRNGRYLGKHIFFRNLCSRLGYEIEYHYDDWSVHIFPKETK